MGVWVALGFLFASIPLMIIVLGCFMYKRPPKKINHFYGYRTARSMRNQETWDFAHKACGKLWWKLGWGMLALSALICLPFLKSSETTLAVLGLVLCLAQCGALLGSIFFVEKALKQQFNADGSRKEQPLSG